MAVVECKNISPCGSAASASVAKPTRPLPPTLSAALGPGRLTTTSVGHANGGAQTAGQLSDTAMHVGELLYDCVAWRDGYPG